MTNQYRAIGKKKLTRNLFKENFTLKESQCTIISESKKPSKPLKNRSDATRQELEIYVRAQPKISAYINTVFRRQKNHL